VLQSDEVGFRGQFVAAVVAESSEIARQAADMVGVTCDRQPHDTELRADRDACTRRASSIPTIPPTPRMVIRTGRLRRPR
jgi:xanthine dehydrogenase YagR molybdenum-binding subunit